MVYLPRALQLTQDEMVKYILSIPTKGWQWSPIGVTWHNAGEPSLKTWDHYTAGEKKAWPDNLNHYYQYEERWHAGPHFCGSPDPLSYVLGDPRQNGVHASCYNSDHYGVETIGNFEIGGDPITGRGLDSLKASANIIAALCVRFGWDPSKHINFHRWCKRDGHACPGSLVTDDWAINLVVDRIKQLKTTLTGVTTP